MIFKPETDIPEFIKKLNDQKNIYHEMLELSQREENILESKPLRLNQVIEVLYKKEQLMNRIHTIETDIAPFRNAVEQVEMDNVYRTTIDCCVKEIGSLLEKLIESDTKNEEVLQGKVNTRPSFYANRKNAVNAYKNFSR